MGNPVTWESDSQGWQYLLNKLILSEKSQAAGDSYTQQAKPDLHLSGAINCIKKLPSHIVKDRQAQETPAYAEQGETNKTGNRATSCS